MWLFLPFSQLCRKLKKIDWILSWFTFWLSSCMMYTCSDSKLYENISIISSDTLMNTNGKLLCTNLHHFHLVIINSKDDYNGGRKNSPTFIQWWQRKRNICMFWKVSFCWLLILLQSIVKCVYVFSFTVLPTHPKFDCTKHNFLKTLLNKLATLNEDAYMVFQFCKHSMLLSFYW